MRHFHYDRVVFGYHGTNRRTAKRLLNGSPFSQSENDHDWLGRGVYFWEHGPARALEWAIETHGRRSAAVVGALIQTGRCFDLLDTRYAVDLRNGAREFHQGLRAAGIDAPRNAGLAHRLDCALLNWWLDHVADRDGTGFQTVRSAFFEGSPLYAGTEIHSKTHIQIAVRDPDCILGVFGLSGSSSWARGNAS